MTTNHTDERPDLPDGLTYCEICGEPKGRAIDYDIESEELVHVPHFAAGQACRDCRREEAQPR